MAADNAQLQVHIEPRAPIELAELTAALGSISHQYQSFIVATGFTSRSQAKLLVSSVQPGSIDILLTPENLVATGSAAMLLPLIDKYELIQKFAGHLKKLLELFKKKEASGDSITVRDCDDAINIVKPTATHGGVINFTAIKNEFHAPVIVLQTNEAQEIYDGAIRARALLASPQAETKQRVSMTWTRLDRGGAKVEGKWSPDQGLIEEIDNKPHTVMFTDEMAYLKSEMIADEESPFKKVYFVDVEISKAAGGKVAAYRVVGFHGKEDLD